MTTPAYWLVKTEPESFSIQDLAKAPRQTTRWDGVRNYQARNFMRDMKLGDHVFVYHSNADPPHIAGTATVSREAYPDSTAWDENDSHHDPKSTPDHPIWLMVDIRLERVFPKTLSLDQLRAVPALREMELLRKGSRLSVQPVRESEWHQILKLVETGGGQSREGLAKIAGGKAKSAPKSSPPATAVRAAKAGGSKRGKR